MRVDPLDAEAIRQTAKKLVDLATPNAEKYRGIARVNERFVQGEQWEAFYDAKGKAGITQDAWFDDEGIPRLHINHSGNLKNTWTSLMTKDRLTGRAVAASDEPEDTYRAEIAQKVIEFQQRELKTAEKQHECVDNAVQHGTAGLKVYYDPGEDVIELCPVTIFNYVRDPTPLLEDARWVVFEDWISEDEATAELQAAGFEGREAKAQEYENAAGDKLQGVRQLEVWHLPSREYPEGFFASIIEDEVVEAMPYPYVFEVDGGREEYLLPLVEMRVRKVRESAFGKTPLTDVVPLQRTLNEVNARLVKMLRVASKLARILPASVADAMGESGDEDADIIVPDNQLAAAEAIGFTKLPTIPKELFDQRTYYEQTMTTVMGLHAFTAGGDAKTRSGTAQETIIELDQTKNADARKSYEQMVYAMWRLILLLVGRYYTAERKARITNGSAADVFAFSSADVQGVDIAIEPASEVDSLTDVKEQRAVERRKAGLVGDIEWRAVLDRPGYGSSKAMAEGIVETYLSGAPVEVMPNDLNLDVLEAVVAKHKERARAERRRDDWLALNDLQGEIANLRTEAESAQPREPAPQEQPAAPVEEERAGVM